MCYFFSCIVTKDEDILYSMNNNSHDDLIDEYELEDTKLSDRSFVRIEMKPLNGIYSRDKGDWPIIVDEKGTLPVWFEENQRTIYEKLHKILDTVFQNIDNNLFNFQDTPEAKEFIVKYENIRSRYSDTYSSGVSEKELTQKGRDIRKNYRLLDGIEDALYDAISRWFEEKELWGVYDDWYAPSLLIAKSLKERNEEIDEYIELYMERQKILWNIIKS